MDRILADSLLPHNGSSKASSLAVDAGWSLRARDLNETLKEWLLDSIPTQIADLEKILTQFEAEILVTDVGLLGPVLVLREKSELPLAAFSVLAGCSIPGPDAPPWGRGLASPKNFRTRFRVWVEKKAIGWLTSGEVS